MRKKKRNNNNTDTDVREFLSCYLNYLTTRSHDKNSPPKLVKVISSVYFSCLSFMSNILLKALIIPPPVST